MEAGAFDWAPSCSEPWTTGQWREALQRAAAAALNKDPSYVSLLQKQKKMFFKFSSLKNSFNVKFAELMVKTQILKSKDRAFEILRDL